MLKLLYSSPQIDIKANIKYFEGIKIRPSIKMNTMVVANDNSNNNTADKRF